MKNGKRSHRFRSFFLIKLPAAFFALSLIWVIALKWIPVRCTPLMLQRTIEYRADRDFKTVKKWVPLEEISPEMIRAVVSAEDSSFYKHKGIQARQIKLSIERYRCGRDKRLGGASTISQQTAKNVFLLPVRSWIRKGIELYFTFLIEAFWGKDRIMEVYLNVVETGKGLYGVEAAAQSRFNKTAAQLNRRESAQIACSLPLPLKWEVGARPPEPVWHRSFRVIMTIDSIHIDDRHFKLKRPKRKEIG